MNISTLVPNQRVVLFPKYKQGKFPVSLVRHLSGNELKLYMYLWDTGTDNGKIVLYSSVIAKDVGYSNKTYFKAFKGLIHNGFLTKEESNTYRFHPEKYTVTDEDMMKLAKEYIYSHYGKYRDVKPLTGYSSFRLTGSSYSSRGAGSYRFNPELDIIPGEE